MIRNWMLLVICCTVMAGCQSTSRPDPVSAKQALDEAQQQSTASIAPPPLSAEIQAELMPELAVGQADLLQVERRFDVNARNVEAKSFFTALVKGSSLNIAVHPGVEGRITLKLKEVTLEEALDVVRDIYGYDVQRRGRILHIYPAGMRIETIPLNYLMLERNGFTRTRVNSGGITDNTSDSSYSSSSDSSSSSSSSSTSSSDSFNGSEIESSTKTHYWVELENTLRGMIGASTSRDSSASAQTTEGRMVVVSPQAGLVTVRAYPDEIRIIRDFLQRSEQQLQRQVILEAKIIEVVLSDDYQQGVSWSVGDLVNSESGRGESGSVLGTTPVVGNEISQIVGGGGALTISRGDFTAVVSLLETQGDVNVLSSPRITASNNQKAVIKVGTDEYFVTDVSTTTVSGTSTTTTPSVQLTPFFSGIALDVTPQIDANDSVLLHVHPSVTDVSEQRKTISFGTDGDDLDLPLAQSDIRESDTVIRADSGDVVVIGGLMRNSQQELISRVPFIGSLPVIGELFTSKAITSEKTELIILLKPTVVKQDTWQQELERSRDLLNTWYPEP
ncbi:pilus (MSHA type) biogenesis protein MshL [Aliagarivorans taiwanensis]|uniref:pilus (MSHA type) biogenesis protein MshL n=1 Tax=Aliagarivorans taiwanensis TaxID=561966 RepID=UPI00055053A7|nr:pilus (MSHA type) biogenesis protein MshL [Aliagarivorans taiwanensis]